MAKAKFPSKKQVQAELNKRKTPKQFEIGDTHQCALAYAYRAITGSSARVGHLSYSPGDFGSDLAPLPKWAVKFVAKFDQSDGTLKEARKLLK